MGIIVLVVLIVAVMALAGIVGGPSRYHCPKCEAYWADQDAKAKSN